MKELYRFRQFLAEGVIKENTLEYLYKINSIIAELDSAALKSFESDTRVILKGNMSKINPDILIEYRKNRIRHKRLSNHIRPPSF